MLIREPFCERAQFDVMRPFLRNGHRVQPIRHCRRSETRLGDELGIAPMPATQASHDSIAKEGSVPPLSGLLDLRQPDGGSSSRIRSIHRAAARGRPGSARDAALCVCRDADLTAP
jgi:hypothetical protein